MAKTAYVDETKRKHYLLCAVVVDQSDIAFVRRELGRLREDHGTIHMNDRSDSERLAFARALGAFPVEGVVVDAHVRPDRAARDLVLRRMVPYLLGLGVTRLVIESCDEDRADRQLLRELLGPEPALSYSHDGKAELMLALPDILGWSYGRGRRYAAAVRPIVTDLGTTPSAPANRG